MAGILANKQQQQQHETEQTATTTTKRNKNTGSTTRHGARHATPVKGLASQVVSMSSWPVMKMRMSPGGWDRWICKACFTAAST